MIEALDRLLPREKPEASDVIAEAFAFEGIDVRTGQQLALARRGAARLHLQGGDSLVADRVLVAVGRRGATAGDAVHMMVWRLTY